MERRYRRGFSTAEKTEALGSVATRGIVEIDWARIWQAVIVNLFPAGAVRRDQAGTPPALAAGIDVIRARGDIARDCGSAVAPLYGIVTGPLGLNGEP